MTPAPLVFLAGLLSCAPLDGGTTAKPGLDSGTSDHDPLEPLEPLEPADEDDTEVSDHDSGESAPPPADDASFQTATLPSALSCGETVTAAIAMRNTGTATWTRADGYKLGTVDDSDPFHPHTTRVWLSDEDSVATGEVWTFEMELQAPDEAGTYTTDWRMVHEAVQWFGEALTQEIVVNCDAPVTPDVPDGPPDLDEVVWLHTDVSDWAETGVLSSVSISGSQICLDYDKADVWPILDLRGTEVVANPWIFIWQDETWYAATWEWMRPGQICKAMSSVHSSHIKVDPFPEDGDWAPTSGQTYWFMMSGLGRWSERTVLERTNLASVVWP